jgi:eukaryotic-like serine/threonine-protein kinase
MLARGRTREAEESVRKACELVSVVPPYALLGLTGLINVRIQQGRATDACAHAEEGLRILSSLGGAGCTEVPFRVAAAEAWYAAGDLAMAREALREALRQIDIRASKIPDAALREQFLAGRPENVRASALARAWTTLQVFW